MKTTLCLTTRCNLRCAHCYHAARAPQDMSVETLERAVGLAFRRGSAEERLEFGLFGGEPLLRFDLVARAVDLVRSAERAGATAVPASVSVTTNGTLVTDEVLSCLRDGNVEVCFSVDGAPAAHDARRSFSDGSGTSSTVFRNLEKAVAALPYVQTNTVYDPRALPDLADTAALLAGLGAGGVHLNLDVRADWSGVPQEAFDGAFLALADLYVAFIEAGRVVRLNPIESKLRVLLNGGLTPRDLCASGKRQWTVGPSGDLYGCERLMAPSEALPVRLRALPSVDGLLDELAGKAIAAVDNPECGTCELRPFCANRCACTNQHLTGSRSRVGSGTCRSEQAAVRAAARVLARVKTMRKAHLLHEHLARQCRSGPPVVEECGGVQ